MMPTTPSGCGISRFLAGMNCSAVAIRCGAIHFFRCLAACLISPSTSSVSAIAVSVGQRWPKSAEIACSKRASLSEIDRAQPRQPVEPLAERRRRRGPRQLEQAVKGVIQGALPRAFQGLVHGGSPRDIVGPEAGLLHPFWQERFGGPNMRTPVPTFRAVIKSGKDAPRAFPKRACVGTYRSRPKGIARVAFSGSLRTGSIGAPRRWPASFRHRSFEGAQWFIAGWSSPVARQAHNLKVIGSNPIPATKI